MPMRRGPQVRLNSYIKCSFFKVGVRECATKTAGPLVSCENHGALVAAAEPRPQSGDL